jgi:hexosaminidase
MWQIVESGRTLQGRVQLSNCCSWHGFFRTSPDAWVLSVLLGCLLAGEAFAANTTLPAIIPAPRALESQPGEFVLRSKTRIVVDQDARATGEFLAERLRKATGYKLNVEAGEAGHTPKGSICLTVEGAKLGCAPEGYRLAVAPDSVVVRGTDAAGVFYGAQTLLQLLPPTVFASQSQPGRRWTMPCVRIEDEPRFAWRGYMLDVSRHFFTKTEIERLLDAMALYKVNIFHWHLVDGVGWRLEIKRYPRLTQIGAWRKDIGYNMPTNASTAYGPDGRYGGYYTQDEIREVVAYAQARHITIVPEIEMPGHCRAALCAYPELSCFGGPYDTESEVNPTPAAYCAGKEETFVFLQNVLTEVFTLFPGKYVHIGGDEVNKENWKKCPLCQTRTKAEGLKSPEELQSYFVRRVEKFINAQGRTLVGWSEISQGGLAENAVVMDWIGGGLEGARAGHDVIMSPEEFCYLDHCQSTNRATEPRAFGHSTLNLSKIYAWDPLPEGLSPSASRHILGAQANLWTEYVAGNDHVEYMTFPRLCALAEVAWSPKASRNYTDFTRRLQSHMERFDCMGLHYRKAGGSCE